MFFLYGCLYKLHINESIKTIFFLLNSSQQWKWLKLHLENNFHNRKKNYIIYSTVPCLKKLSKDTGIECSTGNDFHCLHSLFNIWGTHTRVRMHTHTLIISETTASSKTRMNHQHTIFHIHSRILPWLLFAAHCTYSCCIFFFCVHGTVIGRHLAVRQNDESVVGLPPWSSVFCAWNLSSNCSMTAK
jgi:hypothetical protein